MAVMDMIEFVGYFYIRSMNDLNPNSPPRGRLVMYPLNHRCKPLDSIKSILYKEHLCFLHIYIRYTINIIWGFLFLHCGLSHCHLMDHQ